jgi:hypothetical protein
MPQSQGCSCYKSKFYFLDFKSGGCKDYEPPISVTDVEMCSLLFCELFSKTGCKKADAILDEVAGEVKLGADGTTMGSISCVAPELPGPSAGNNDECANKGKLHDYPTWRCLSDEAVWLSRRSSDRDAGNHMQQNITRRREGFRAPIEPSNLFDSANIRRFEFESNVHI